MTPRSAIAQTFQITATGNLNYVDDAQSAFDSPVVTGAQFTFTFIGELSTPGYGSAPTSYYFPTLEGATSKFGDYTFLSDSQSDNIISVYNDLVFVGSPNPPEDDIQVETSLAGAASTSTSAKPLYYTQTGIDLTDITGKLLSSEALPTLATYAISNFSTNGLGFQTFVSSQPDYDYNHMSFVGGTITNLSASLLAPAPEPSQYLAFGVGLLGLSSLALRARRRGVTGG